jgi:hypothetical protein
VPAPYGFGVGGDGRGAAIVHKATLTAFHPSAIHAICRPDARP